MRIAQLIFMKLPEIELHVTQELDETDRGSEWIWFYRGVKEKIV